MSDGNRETDLDLDSPWHVVVRPGSLLIEDADGPVATVDASVEDAEDVARLIAAAPDLLDAAADLLVAMASLDTRDEDFTPRKFDISDPALADMPEDELILLVNTRIKRLGMAVLRAEVGDDEATEPQL